MYCQGTFKGSWSHMVKWGKKTCMNMHEVLVFGIEINTCKCVDAYVCARIYSHICLWYVCLPVPRLSLRSDTAAWQPQLPPRRRWKWLFTVCLLYSGILYHVHTLSTQKYIVFEVKKKKTTVPLSWKLGILPLIKCIEEAPGDVKVHYKAR